MNTIINLAPTGMIPTKATSAAVPVTPAEIIRDVRQCAPLGISMVHLHARNDDETPTHRKEVFAEIIGGIRETNPELVLIATTSGRTYQEFSQRAEVLELEGILKPDMASLTLSSVNFNRTASINSPDMIMRLVDKMRSNDIRPEMEIFDLGMINFAHYLIRKGMVEPPYYFNILLGNVAAAQAKLLHLGVIVSELPEHSIFCVAGIGNAQMDMNVLGMLMGHGVRVGLEDNIWFDKERTIPATNYALVERLVGIAGKLGRKIATPQDVRGYLRLPQPSIRTLAPSSL